MRYPQPVDAPPEVATLIPTNRGLKGTNRSGTEARASAVATLIPTNRGLKDRVRYLRERPLLTGRNPHPDE